tara:strand:- start:380 stop:985 length:606 start_codon:yes stop_codon:yes gene_type:complete
MIAYCIGNGESRRFLNLPKLTENKTVIGCNALHRDLAVDHLICCDRRMADEAIKSDNTANTKIYVRDMWFKYFRKIKKDKRINHLPDLPYKGEKKIDQPLHWGSGTYALLVAANLPDITEIRLIGFDLYDKNSKVNNIYKNTVHYAKKDDKPVDFSYWVYQAQKVFVHYPQIKFNIINSKDWQIPTQWKLPNVSSQLLTTA